MKSCYDHWVGQHSDEVRGTPDLCNICGKEYVEDEKNTNACEKCLEKIFRVRRK